MFPPEILESIFFSLISDSILSVNSLLHVSKSIRGQIISLLLRHPPLSIDIVDAISHGEIPFGNTRILFQHLSSIPALIFSSICKYGGSQGLLKLSLEYLDPTIIFPVYSLIPPPLRRGGLLEWEKIDPLEFPTDLFCVDHHSMSHYEKKTGHPLSITAQNRLDCIKSAAFGQDPKVQSHVFKFMRNHDFPILLDIYLKMDADLSQIHPFISSTPQIARYITSYIITHWRFMPLSATLKVLIFYLEMGFAPTTILLNTIIRIIQSEREEMKPFLDCLPSYWYKKIPQEIFLQQMIYLKFEYAIWVFLMCTRNITESTLHLLFLSYAPSSFILRECDALFHISSFSHPKAPPTPSILFQKNMVYWFGCSPPLSDPILSLSKKRKRLLQ